MKNLFLNNKAAFIIGAIGLILALLILSIGFWKALLILLLTGAGILIGMVIDGNPIIKNGMDKLKK